MNADGGSIPSDVSAETGLEINSKGNLEFVGENLYMGFKTLEPSVKRVEDRMSYSMGDDGREGPELMYRLYIQGLHPESDPTEVDVRVVNNRIGIEPIEFSFKSLKRGDIVKLAEIGNLKDFLQVLEIGNGLIEVAFERVTYNVEHGAPIEAKPTDSESD